jgi:hypothetical protein
MISFLGFVFVVPFNRTSIIGISVVVNIPDILVDIVVYVRRQVSLLYSQQWLNKSCECFLIVNKSLIIRLQLVNCLGEYDKST